MSDLTKPNMLLSKEDPEFLQRAYLYLEAEQTTDQIAQFQAELVADPHKCRIFVRLCSICAEISEEVLNAEQPQADILCEEAEPTDSKVADSLNDASIFPAIHLADDAQANSLPIATPIKKRDAIRAVSARRRWPRYAAMILIPLLLAGALWPVLHHRPEAVLASSEGAQWERAGNPLYLAPGDELPGTSLTLAAGTAQLNVGNGVAVTLRSPVSFQVLSRSIVAVSSGRLAAVVPHDIIGFTVQTPKLSVVDLGTEFGVDVQPDQDQVRVQVFKGMVRTQGIDASNDSPLQQSLSAGEGAVVHGGTLTREPAAASATAFLAAPSAPAIATPVPSPALPAGFTKWQASISALSADPTVVACYTFDNQRQAPDKLLNRSHYGASLDGVLSGQTPTGKPVWSVGRWPEKGALQFHGRVGELVALPDSPLLNFSTGSNQTARAFTLAAWINVADSRAPDGIVVCRGPVRGDQYTLGIHSGELTSWVGSSADPIRRASGISQLLPATAVGTWVHIASVYNPIRRTYDLYLNGQMCQHRMVSPTLLPNRESATIGCRPEGTRRSESFIGKIDEVVIWSRALSAEEIAQLYEAESP